MRRHSFVGGEYYHVYCHSVSGLKIFRNNIDYHRFLILLFAANGEASIPRLDRLSFDTVQAGLINGSLDIGKHLVDVICFCIMPTHFHLLLRARKSRDAGNVSNYIHKVLVSHSKYFNTRYERRGHLFESTFHSRHVDTNEYLVYLSRYLHKNPKDIKIWQGRESVYPWSSYQDYIGDNRWRSLLRPEIILKQYDNPREYREYVESSSRDDDDTRRLLTWR